MELSWLCLSKLCISFWFYLGNELKIYSIPRCSTSWKDIDTTNYNRCKRVNKKFNKSMIYLLLSSYTEKRITRKVCIPSSNKTELLMSYRV